MRKEHSFFPYVNPQVQINQVPLRGMQKYGLGY